MTYRELVLSHQPIAYWKFDETAGPTVHDETGHGYDGTITGSLTFQQPGAVPGESGKSCRFHGAEFATVNAPALDSARFQHSLEAWVSSDLLGPAGNGGLIEKTIGGVVNTCALLFFEATGIVYRTVPAGGTYTDIRVKPVFNKKGWMHVVGTYDGANMRLYVNGKLAVSRMLSGALSDGPGELFLGKLATPNYNLIGLLDEAALYPRALNAAEIASHYANAPVAYRPHLTVEMEQGYSTWFMVDDVILGSTTFSRGLPGINSTDFIAGTGTFQFTLDNSEFNSQGKLGLYTPGHANAMPGFDTQLGVRCIAWVGGEPFTQFTGRILNIMTSTGVHGMRRVKVFAVDYMDQLARKRLVNLPLQVDATDDAVFRMIIAEMPVMPRAVQVDQGFDTLQYAFDTMSAERAVPTSEIARLCKSTLRRCYVQKDGTLTFESRSVRALNTAQNVITLGPSDYLLDNGPSVEDNRDIVVNRVQTTLHPRKTGETADVILFELEGTPQVQANYPFAIRGFYTEPGNLARRAGGLDMLPAVPHTDYTFNVAADNSGADVTLQVAVATIYTANSVVFQIDSPVSCYCTKLQARGTAVMDQANIITEASDQDSIDRYGENNLSLDMPYTGDVAFGQEVVQYLLFLEQQTSKRVKDVTLLLNDKPDSRQKLIVQREISDRIGIEEPMNALPTIMAEGHYINKISMQEDANGNLFFAWTLALADATQYWYLEIPGFSELDFTTRLGFGLVIGHTDIAHADEHGDINHSDVAHNDYHGDITHEDAAHSNVAHTDVAHQNVAHTDVAHANSHGDQGHADSAHQDSHTNIAHSNSHGDVAHVDGAHGDNPGQGYTNIAFTNQHTNAHTDQGPPYGYLNSHDDNYTNQSHVDDGGWPHTNQPHYDGAHTNWHGDVGHQDGHWDVAHTNVPQNISHSDVAHSDVAHADYHADGGHGDASHGDIAHTNNHTNIVHSNIAHSDSHGDSAHGDKN